MNDKTRKGIVVAVVVVVIVGLGVYGLGSGQLLRWLLALHGKH